jgi:acyl carrier protein
MVDDSTLQECDSEDIGDIFPMIEKSFNLKFQRSEFANVKTFGDICKIVEDRLDFELQDCSLQQGFYKLRSAVSNTVLVDQDKINLSSKLEGLFPRETRIRDWKRLEKELGFKVAVLTMKSGLLLTLLVGFVVSILCFFLNWKYALTGLIGLSIVSKFLSLFSKEFSLLDMDELTRKVTSENYSVVRRKKNSGNKQEVFTVLQELFASNLSISKEFLTKEAELPR